VNGLAFVVYQSDDSVNPTDPPCRVREVVTLEPSVWNGAGHPAAYFSAGSADFFLAVSFSSP
jgi:hypothetical protein